MTTGELIRALRRYYSTNYDLNLAVAALRRESGSKNWYVAAVELLTALERGPFEGAGKLGAEKAPTEAPAKGLIHASNGEGWRSTPDTNPLNSEDP